MGSSSQDPGYGTIAFWHADTWHRRSCDGCALMRQDNVFYAPGRLWLVMFLLLIGVVAIVYRLFDLVVVDKNFLKKQGDARTMRVASIPAYRGMIRDRLGNPLAVSTPVFAVWANPLEARPAEPYWQQLSVWLDLPLKTLQRKLKRASHLEFVYLKRGIQPLVADMIKAERMPGIYLLPEYKRFYPEGEVTAHLVGFTNVDDVGQEGLELAFNHWLQGFPGRKKVHKDRLGRIIQELDVLKVPRSGQDLDLSIDRRIQYVAYRELKSAVRRFQLKSGSIVVLDAKTGEVLAMANHPSFNPNRREGVKTDLFRNRAVTDVFEPGSVMKPFPIASALNSGQYGPDDLVDTSPGWMRLENNYVRDLRDLGKISVTEILKKSSNVGIAKLLLSMPAERYVNLLRHAGFGQATQSGYPGELHGLLVEREQWRSHTLATLGFGYSIAVTTLQLAQAYSVFTGDGRLKSVSLLKLERPVVQRSVLSPVISRQMRDMLESVVAKGTGKHARVKGYRVAGKTGTARIAGSGGYHKDRHVASFVGMAPASDPRVIIAVVLQEPQGEDYYGGVLAAPVFSHIMADTLRLLQIPFDQQDMHHKAASHG